MTQKTLKDLFEVYKPKSPDEQKFVDKHVTIKHKDRNGNGDDVFNGNTKYIKRKEERHGYDVNDDEKVYEEVEDLDESVAKVANHLIKRYGENVRKSHVRSAANDFGVGFVALSHHVRKKLGVNRLEEEQIDELSTSTLKKYRAAAKADAIDADDVDDNRRYNQRAAGYKKAGKIITKRGENMLAKEEAELEEARPVNNPEYDESEKMWNKRKEAWEAEQKKNKATNESTDLDEKKLTPAEMKKREEIAKAMERENPGMDKSKKMAIATATAKRVAEEARIEEGSYKDGETRMGSVGPITTDAERAERAKKYREKMMKKESTDYLETDLKKRKKNNDKAIEDMKKMGSPMKNPHFGEEVEELDEISAATLRSYTAKASDARGHRNLPTAKVDNRYKGVALAHEKIRGRHTQVPATEEVENVEEAIGDVTVANISAADAFKKRTGQLTSKSTVPMDPKTGKTLYQKMTKEDIINNAIEKFMPELEDYVPMTQEEKLVAKIEHLPEAHIHTLLSLYENLNEDNRNKMMMAVDTQEGINSLIDFAIQNRGE